jgi:Tfp pilus assembly protein PilV
MIEVMVALSILVVGLLSTALLMANVFRLSVRSRYMADASMLASEKLEDLNRWPVTTSNGTVTYVDPHILVPDGSNSCGTPSVTCVGSLSADYGPQTITDLSGNETPVSYFDSVSLSTQNGVMSETYETMGGASPNYATVPLSPNGQTPMVTNSSTPPTAGMTFDRRWVIEQDQPVAGVRRITVLVTLMDRTVQPPVTFQMSMVRP